MAATAGLQPIICCCAWQQQCRQVAVFGDCPLRSGSEYYIGQRPPHARAHTPRGPEAGRHGPSQRCDRGPCRGKIRTHGASDHRLNIITNAVGSTWRWRRVRSQCGVWPCASRRRPRAHLPPAAQVGPGLGPVAGRAHVHAAIGNCREHAPAGTHGPSVYYIYASMLESTQQSAALKRAGSSRDASARPHKTGRFGAQ